MEQRERSEPTLPASVREGLERFCAQIREALGEQLRSVVLYGAAAKGEHPTSHPDVNVMIIVKEVTVETLDQAAAPVRQATRDFPLSVMLLSEHDLRRKSRVA